MKKILTVILLSLSVSLISPIYAGTFSCSANVNKVLLYKSGVVNVLHSGRNNYTVVCSLNEEWKGVSVTTCAMWVGLLQDLKRRNVQAIFYYSTNEATSCADLPIYGNAPSPVYIGEF